MKILDFYNHQGHQYEFSKIDYDIYLVGLDNKKPDWDENMRPLRENVILSDIYEGVIAEPDIVMWRRGADYKWCKRLALGGAKCVGVAQTTYFDYTVPKFVDVLVWNSKGAMDKLYKHYPWCEHVYIPHGFSPDEFEDFGEDRDSRILSVISKFFERREILGYYNWQKVSNLTGLIDLYGHGNEDLEESMGSASSFINLIWLYNSYKVFLNPTIESAMPRSRGEAMMCGMPVVTTSYYDISDYIVHGENGFLADDYYDMIKFSKKIISDKSCFDQISKASRETAIEYFNIETYLKKYKEIFSS